MIDNLEQNILKAWENIQNSLTEQISSEKTLVFKFAMEMAKNYQYKDALCIDFEYQAYNEIATKDKYLDLFIRDKNTNKQYAIEFKAPTKSGKGNSNQKVTRKNIYKDIARLQYLKEYHGFQNCFFFMITDEMPYINKSTRRDNTYDTSDGHEGSLIEFIKEYNISKNQTFVFSWEKKSIYHCLKPIVL